MKRILTAAMFAAMAMTGQALADDVAAANERCIAISTQQATANLPPDTPEEQKAMMHGLIADICGCLTTRLSGMGDDGAMALRVMAVQSDEDIAVTDPVKQRSLTVALLVREFGISEADAGAAFDRFGPKVQETALSCQQEGVSKLQGAQQ